MYIETAMLVAMITDPIYAGYCTCIFQIYFRIIEHIT